MEATVADGQGNGQAVVVAAAAVDILGHVEADWRFVSGGGVRREQSWVNDLRKRGGEHKPVKHLVSKPLVFVDVLAENHIVPKMKHSINELCWNLPNGTSFKTIIYCFMDTPVFVSYLIILRGLKT